MCHLMLSEAYRAGLESGMSLADGRTDRREPAPWHDGSVCHAALVVMRSGYAAGFNAVMRPQWRRVRLVPRLGTPGTPEWSEYVTLDRRRMAASVALRGFPGTLSRLHPLVHQPAQLWPEVSSPDA